MTNATNLTKIVQKYSSREITTAVKVLLDILALHEDEGLKNVDPKDEFTRGQIKRLEKQLADHKQGKTEQLSLTEVARVLGL